MQTLITRYQRDLATVHEPVPIIFPTLSNFWPTVPGTKIRTIRN